MGENVLQIEAYCGVGFAWQPKPNGEMQITGISTDSDLSGNVMLGDVVVAYQVLDAQGAPMAGTFSTDLGGIRGPAGTSIRLHLRRFWDGSDYTVDATRRPFIFEIPLDSWDRRSEEEAAQGAGFLRIDESREDCELLLGELDIPRMPLRHLTLDRGLI